MESLLFNDVLSTIQFCLQQYIRAMPQNYHFSKFQTSGIKKQQNK